MDISNALAIFSMLATETFRLPCSMLAMYVLSRSQAKANRSWLSPFLFLSSRSRCPIFTLMSTLQRFNFVVYQTTDYKYSMKICNNLGWWVGLVCRQ